MRPDTQSPYDTQTVQASEYKRSRLDEEERTSESDHAVEGDEQKTFHVIRLSVPAHVRQ